MTNQSGGLASGLPVGGVLSGSLPNPLFATDGTTPLFGTLVDAVTVDVSMANANQFYDGPSVAVTAGRWWVVAKIVIISGNPASQGITGKLWDGTTSIDADEAETTSTGFVVSLKCSGVYVAVSAAALKFSAASSAAVNTIKAAPNLNSPGNLASTISALRIP